MLVSRRRGRIRSLPFKTTPSHVVRYSTLRSSTLLFHNAQSSPNQLHPIPSTIAPSSSSSSPSSSANSCSPYLITPPLKVLPAILPQNPALFFRCPPLLCSISYFRSELMLLDRIFATSASVFPCPEDLISGGALLLAALPHLRPAPGKTWPVLLRLGSGGW
jgi:hypothetical protein